VDGKAQPVGADPTPVEGICCRAWTVAAYGSHRGTSWPRPPGGTADVITEASWNCTRPVVEEDGRPARTGPGQNASDRPGNPEDHGFGRYSE